MAGIFGLVVAGAILPRTSGVSDHPNLISFRMF